MRPSPLSLLSSSMLAEPSNSATSTKATSMDFQSRPESALTHMLASSFAYPSSVADHSTISTQQHHQQQQEPPRSIDQQMPHKPQQFASHGDDDFSLNGEESVMIVSPAHSPRFMHGRVSRSADDYLNVSREAERIPALMACSHKTLEQEYNRNTWRMYERIQNARLKQARPSAKAERHLLSPPVSSSLYGGASTPGSNLSRGQLISVVGEALEQARDCDIAAFEDFGNEALVQSFDNQDYDDEFQGETDDDIFDFEL